MKMQTSEYTSLSTSPSKQLVDSDGKSNKYWKSVATISIVGLIGLLIFVSQSSSGFGHWASPHASVSSHAVISTSAKDYDYSANRLISHLSDVSQDSYISDDCQFISIEDSSDGVVVDLSLENYESILKSLLLKSENEDESSFVTHYEMTTISKPLYTVEWIFGTKTSEHNENEHFTIVLQIDPENDNKIFEMYLFTSKYSDESGEALYRRLFNAFDFNKNGVLCITEFPSMMGAISGLGNVEMSNQLLSYMNDKTNHIKFTQDEFVSLILTDDIATNVNNFGDLRHIVQNAIVDGYMAFISEENTCLYYDLSWNCHASGDYYATADGSEEAVFSVSESIFASVCCDSQ